LNEPRLIVNADDFGASDEVNEAIIRAHREGVLTSTSLMVTGDAFDNAVVLAKENPRLAVGIHLVTVVGKSVLAHSEIPSIVDRMGRFSNDPVSAGLKYFFSSTARRELRREIRAQFEKFKATGLPLSHIDGHLHLHVHPVIFKTALELGVGYGCRRMRVPVEERALALKFDSSNVAIKTVHAVLFSALGAYMKSKLRPYGYVVPERVYGNLQSGRMNEAYFLYALEHLRCATSEIYFHPAIFNETGASEVDRLSAEQRQLQVEFEALTSPRVAERIRSLGIKLTNYPELERA